jgi:hypothetical protein
MNGSEPPLTRFGLRAIVSNGCMAAEQAAYKMLTVKKVE